MNNQLFFGDATAEKSFAPSQRKPRRPILCHQSLPLSLRLISWIIIVTQLLAPYYGKLFATTFPEQISPGQTLPNPHPSALIAHNQPSPPIRPPSLIPEFSKNPADIEFFHVHLFSLPLIPVGGKTSTEENRDLAKTLMAFSGRTNNEDISSLLDFLAAHPGSAWEASLFFNVGKLYRSRGYISRALDAWERVWNLVKADTTDAARLVGEVDAGELAELYGRLGRMQSLDSLLKDVANRNISGPSAAKLFAARQGLWIMNNKPEIGFMCGPYALSNVRAALGEKDVFPPVLKKSFSTTNGTSLAQLMQWSKDMNMHLQMAKRKPASEIICPSVVNWKAGHFAALVKQQGDQVLMKDPVFEQEIWISTNALDDEGSGYFLVREGNLPAGWEAVEFDEATNVWGKGWSPTGSQNNQRTYDKKCKCPPASPSPGMAQYNINAMLPALTVFDTPVGYQPPRGRAVQFLVSYDQFDVSDFGTVPTISNMGPNFNYGYLSYLIFDPSSPSTTMNLFVRGGGKETYTGYNSTSQTFAPQEDDGAILHQVSTNSFVRNLADGSSEIFDLPMAQGSSQIVFLTKIIDPMGNTTSLAYDEDYRLANIIDAIGQTNTVYYVSTNSGDMNLFYKISQVKDPFGRSAYFTYSTTYPYQLNQITDVIGINSQFSYTNNNYMSALTTPYGTTTFTYGGELGGYTNWVQATDPEGSSEKAEFDGLATTPGVLSWEIVPTNVLNIADDGSPGYSAGNGYLQYRNTFYWDKNAMQQAPGNYTKAKIFHWMHVNFSGSTSHILESVKMPMESRVWYRYPGQSPYNNELTITNSSPSAVSRLLDDGTTQIYKYQYSNIYNKATQAIDPMGRTTLYTYAANGIDLVQVQQVNGATTDLLSTITYNSQHLPTNVVDASGQTNYFGYNSFGQLTSITNALNQTVTLSYDDNGYLTNTVGSLPGSTNAFTYDNFGRVLTSTDSSGYAVTYAYDNLDRVTKITHPDGTYEQIIYDKLDPILQRDRRGHWTATTFDTLRRVRDVRDSLNRVTHFEWCGCGSLSSITDPLGNTTTWLRDVEGRPTQKILPDLTTIQYGYGPSSGRLASVTDAKNQTTLYNYFVDNNLSQVTYSNAVIATSNVSYTYDTNYNRLITMTDGVGLTSNYYNPVTVPAALGAGRLASVSGPIGNSFVTYQYDQLGRVTNRAINGAAMTMAFDALGRITNSSNVLGSFTNAYVGATMRLSSVSYPNGQGMVLGYFDTNNDLRLQTILNTNASGSVISRFDYTYDADGQIQTWTKQADTTSTNTLTLQYDPVDQLLGGVLAQSGVATNILHQYLYNYDQSGNRTGEQVDSAPVGANFNQLNQMTNQISNGLVQFSGNTSKTDTVNVASVRAAMTNQTNFSATIVTQNGTNTVQITATDLNGNTGVTNYQLVVTNNTLARTLTYDLNGNLTTNATTTGTNTFEWDAANRLTAVNEAGTNRSEFTYDGAGRRVQIVEKTNGVACSTKTFVWCGQELCEERDATGTNVTKRFFMQGEQISGTNYYFTKDHLGNVREMTDNAGTIRARYDYDPYGRLTKVSGDMNADFAFTGHYNHANSGLYLTLYRAYDPNTGRWISRDPWAEHGGLNLYRYVGNEPTFGVDSLGLAIFVNNTSVVIIVSGGAGPGEGHNPGNEVFVAVFPGETAGGANSPSPGYATRSDALLAAAGVGTAPSTGLLYDVDYYDNIDKNGAYNSPDSCHNSVHGDNKIPGDDQGPIVWVDFGPYIPESPIPRDPYDGEPYIAPPVQYGYNVHVSLSGLVGAIARRVADWF